MRKRESRNNKTTKAAQRIEPLDEPRRNMRPKGRSFGGKWVRVKRR